MKKLSAILLTALILVGCSSTKWYEPSETADLFYDEELEVEVIPFGLSVELEDFVVKTTRYSYPSSISLTRSKLKPADGMALIRVQIEVKNISDEEKTFGSSLGVNSMEFFLFERDAIDLGSYQSVVDVELQSSYSGITIAPDETKTYDVYFHIDEEVVDIEGKYLMEVVFSTIASNETFYYFEFK